MLDGGRIFHVNINCTDLARSQRFYVDALGLTEGVRTTPDEVQSGTAFGLDRALWDAVILIGSNGFDGGAVDLLQWMEPPPVGAPPPTLDQAGFQRIGVHVPDVDRALAEVAAAGGAVVGAALVADPDGTVIELIAAAGSRLAFVAVMTSDLERSAAFYQSLGFRAVTTAATEVVMEAPIAGEVQLVLVGSPGTAAPTGTRRTANTLGMWRTALLVPDLDRVVARLQATQIELISDVQSMSMGPGLPELRFVCFWGPDGEVIELIEAPEPTSGAA